MSPRTALLVPAYTLTLLALGCSRHDPPPARNIDSTAPHAGPSLLERPPPRSEVSSGDAVDTGARRRHRCNRDADCLLSCTYGAVNGNWYHAALPSGEACEDGCAAKGFAASCDAGRCVAKRNGVLAPECTGLVKPVPVTKRAE